MASTMLISGRPGTVLQQGRALATVIQDVVVEVAQAHLVGCIVEQPAAVGSVRRLVGEH